MKSEYRIGEKLKFFRQLNGLSQKEMSTGICSQAEISKIENGKAIPTVELLQQIAYKLDVPISEIVKDDSDKNMENVRVLDLAWNVLLRENKFEECLQEMKRITSLEASDEVLRMMSYYKIVIAYRQKQVDYRTTSVLFTRLIDQENLIVQDPILFFRIKMALSILYAERGQYQQAEKIYDEVLRITTEISGLKEERLKVLYNYAKLLYKMDQSEKGFLIVEQGMQLSKQLKQTSYLAHLYYQRGEFHERIGTHVERINHDYTMAYQLFTAFQMKQYAQIVLDKKRFFLQSILD